MSVLSLFHMRKDAKRFGLRLRRDIQGTAAIELVLLTPMLLLFMMGTLEVSRAINVDKRINSVTAMAGDLIAREDKLNNADLNAIMDVVSHVMNPYNPSDLKLSVIPVMADAADATKTLVYADPFKYNGGVSGTPTANSCYSFSGSTNVMTKGSTVIVVKAEYTYTPLYVDFFDGWSFLPTMTSSNIGWDNGGNTFTDQSIHSPRQGCVDFDNNNCVVSTPGGC